MKKLTEKLLDIIAEIPSLSKEGTNVQGRYNYITESSVLKIVKPILLKHGVLVTSKILDCRIENNITIATINHRFIDAQTGEDMVFESYGTGFDMQDKGLYKAITGSLKYFLIKNLLIETDENLDPEFDGKSPKKDLEKMASSGQPFPVLEEKEIIKRQTTRERNQERIAKESKIDEKDNLQF